MSRVMDKINQLLDRSGLRFTLITENLPEQTFAVVDFSLNEALSTPFRLEATLTCKTPEINFADVLDRNAAFAVHRNGQVERQITGMITHFSLLSTGRHSSRYHITLQPPLWRASLRVNSRIFQNQSVVDIVESLLRENGVRNIFFSLGYKHPPREFCVQYDESDLAFIQRLLADEGIFYYFTFDQEQHEQRIVFHDSCLSLNQVINIPYRPESDVTGGTTCVHQFSWSERVGVANITTKDRTFKNPRWNREFWYEGRNLDNQRILNSYHYYDFPSRFKDDDLGQRASQYRLEYLRRDTQLGNGHGDCFAMWPGQLVNLDDHPREAFNDQWQLIHITHSGRQAQADETRSGEGGTWLSNQFTFTTRKNSYRPSPYPKPKMEGPHIATVVGPEGEEIFCDEHGRVRIQFDWDRYGEFNDKSSCWVRVSQAWAGQLMGIIAIPRIGHEVLVDFVHGDPDQPIIVGRAYHANNISPNRLPMAKTQMSIRSKTHKGEGFNELRFEDEKDREEIFIHAQKNLAIQVRNSRDERINYDRTTSIGHDDELVIANNRKVTVEGQQDHKTTGNYIELIDGDRSLQIKGDLAEKIQGVISVDAQGDLTLQSGSKITLSVGGSFVVLHAGGIDIKGAAINLNSGGSPGDLLTPANPAILLAAASEGSMFVAHCPMKENQE
ncbi:Rhs element Vgr family protein [Xenorhabdus mauleonii]|uniref:Rhs element Vgr family protein n=1 Tax=Xenorhabdus mauleonii TaxID=351675 RepID=A0A1I3Q283_9GAMM|nr:type VI secretion system tip protein TssI/VgrG [Xenorhabdus mauleonii]PHM40108.1 Rhs element Vgr family protein [Xenorhabdus mauleonii]SFJ27973.1 type VI secretion system secreted protein VgrG [Xenorhabdus mauleonii]